MDALESSLRAERPNGSDRGAVNGAGVHDEDLEDEEEQIEGDAGEAS
jgi:hypothetical protein